MLFGERSTQPRYARHPGYQFGLPASRSFDWRVNPNVCVAYHTHATDASIFVKKHCEEIPMIEVAFAQARVTVERAAWADLVSAINEKLACDSQAAGSKITLDCGSREQDRNKYSA